ncbi:MAG TPA: tetratricopeptide repeat protein [Pseudonocardiaceae bacterium]
MDVRIRILGQVAALINGRFDPNWFSPRLSYIVAALATQPNRSMNLHELWDWISDDSIHHTGGSPAALNKNIQRLRKKLHSLECGIEVTRPRGAIRLEAAKELIDYWAFRDLLDRANAAKGRGDGGQVRQLTVAALELCQPEGPLAGLDSEPARCWRRKVLNEDIGSATYLLVDQLIHDGEFPAALARLDSLQGELAEEVPHVKRRLLVLYRLGRGEVAGTYFYGLYRRLSVDGRSTDADYLRRINDQLLAEYAGAVGVEPIGAGAAPRRLPPDIPDFVGRDKELTTLDERAGSLDASKIGLLTIDGPGGFGKTSLAIRWINHHLDHHGEDFAGGALSVDLRGAIGSPLTQDEIIYQLLEQYALPATPPTAPQRGNKLRELLDRKRTIILLDNANDSDQVLHLLPALEKSLVVVTSRIRLKGLTKFGPAVAMDRLSKPESARLLTHRIGHARQNPDAVEQLAQSSGGMPLALDLMSSYIAARDNVPLAELADEFQDNNRILSIGDDGDGHSTSVRVTFETSLVKLRSDDQRLFTLIGLHPGAEISEQVLAALAGVPLQRVQTGLDRLFDYHLVLAVRNHRGRYHQHDLLRAYAEELATAMTPADRSAAELRMLGFYTHTAFQGDRTLAPYADRPPLPPVLPGVLPIDLADRNLATAWFLLERINLVATVQYAARAGYHKYAISLPHVTFRSFRRHGYLESARTVLQTARSSAASTGDSEAEIATLLDIGLVEKAMGMTMEARDNFTRAAVLAERAENDHFRASALLRMGDQEIELQKFDIGLDCYRQSLEISERIGYQWCTATALQQIGKELQRRKKYAEAAEYYDHALWVHRQSRNNQGRCETYAQFASLYLERADHVRAEDNAQRAVQLLNEVGDVETSQYALLVLARVLYAARKFEEAIQHARRAVELAKQIHNETKRAESLEVLGDACWHWGEHAQAIEAWQEARSLLDSMGNLLGTRQLDRKLTDGTGVAGALPGQGSTSANPPEERTVGRWHNPHV